MATSTLKAARVVTAPLRFSLFDPRGTAAILIAAIYYPDKLRSMLPAYFHSWIDSPGFIKTLTALLGLGVARGLNRKLSQYMANNWKGDAKFIKSQEVVLITGGASGIGELMAHDFAKRGVKVVVMDLRPPKKPFPSGIHFYQCDVTSSSEIKSTAAEIRKAHGEPTVLINNAGIGTGHSILDESEERIRLTFEINTMAHFWMTKEFVPAMIKKNRGHVVTIASMASYLVHALNVDYSCTKASALAFHEGLASELRSRYNAPNVRTTVVNPAWIRTPLIEKLTSNPKFSDPVLEAEDVSSAIVAQVVSGRSGQLVLPRSMNAATTIRGWPSWLQILVRNILADRLMDEDFKGI
ncbi:hypothetical protein ONS95_012042 [Cadophora gregata]|uniref:uncharacterized protein n=1 Tax=Cadophora gregata TaxID=51156 RepID=UPI0026DC3936|nr:uncharacterized protein ONS95_012042 [Cadophora gregata]KAK0117713.1 hypothetical protein ONS95_012042 [Cadophora gregata]